MRHLFLLSAFLSVCVVVHPVAGQVRGGGDLTFDRIRVDFGDVMAGKDVSHEFTFTNNGRAPLTIRSVDAPCGCTSPDWSRDVVGVGDRGSITVRFFALSPLGSFEKHVAVQTDSGSEVTLTVEGVLVPPVVDPSTAVSVGSLVFERIIQDFGSLAPGDMASEVILVANNGAVPVTILDARSTSPNLSLTFPSAPIRPQEVARLEVSVFSATMERGTFFHRISIDTNDGLEPVKTLEVVGTVGG